MGLFSGERVVSGMILGRKNSMHGSFKGAPGKQFRGFHAAAQLLFIQGLQLRTAINFMSELHFGCVLGPYGNPFEFRIHPYIA